MLEIIKASEINLDELFELHVKYMTYHKKIDSYFNFTLDASEEWKAHIKKLLNDESKVVFIALKEGTIIGFIDAGITKKAPIYEIQNVGSIGAIFVISEYRRQGIAKALAEEVFKWMKKKGIDYVEHPISAKNNASLQTWKSLGFEEYMIWVKRKI